MTNADAGRMERLLGRVLRLGLTVSIGVLMAGLALDLSGLAPEAADWILRAGLMILMATPIARVAASVLEYAAERDWTFLAVTLSVLLVLFASLFAALRVS